MARPKTAGRFRTRELLEHYIKTQDRKGVSHVDIADYARVDPRTVRNILGDCYVGGDQEKYKTHYIGVNHDH